METKLVLNNTNIDSDIRTTELSEVSAIKKHFSIIRFSFIVIQEIVLLVFISIYFIIGAVAVILYMLFYEQLYIKFFKKGKREKQASPYDYKWKKHHLNLNMEE